MIFHRILPLVIILAFTAACDDVGHTIGTAARNITPSFSLGKEEPPPAPKPPPPPSPASPEDRVSLPVGARPISGNLLAPINNKVVVALLLPLSGTSADVGRDLQDAAQLALFDIKNPKLVLLPLDTEGTTTGTIKAMNKAIAGHADIVLGPLFNHEAEVALPIATEHDIKLITFSNDASLAASGAYVFGFMPDEQIERSVIYAIQQGIRDFYVLAPDNGLHKTVENVLQKLKAKYEFTVHDSLTYGASSNKGMVEGARTIAMNINKERKQERTLKDRAVILPEGGGRLISIINIIRGFKLSSNDLRVIGSGQWDDARLLTQHNLNGSWFASASPTQRELFVKHFKDVYGYEPVRIASEAYDAVALTGFLAATSGNRFATGALINERGFAGVDGVFRFNPERIAERSLAVLEVIPNGYEIVSEAPTTLPNFVPKN